MKAPLLLILGVIAVSGIAGAVGECRSAVWSPGQGGLAFQHCTLPRLPCIPTFVASTRAWRLRWWMLMPDAVLPCLQAALSASLAPECTTVSAASQCASINALAAVRWLGLLKLPSSATCTRHCSPSTALHCHQSLQLLTCRPPHPSLRHHVQAGCTCRSCPTGQSCRPSPTWPW